MAQFPLSLENVVGLAGLFAVGTFFRPALYCAVLMLILQVAAVLLWYYGIPFPA